MKTCPVCNDSFPDELNFCDIDGSQLGQDASQASGAHGAHGAEGADGAQRKDRGNWWSLLGAALLVGAVVISAASIIFLPKARVAIPVVSSEPQSLPTAPKASSVDAAASDSSATVAAATSEPDASAADVVAPEPKKRDKSAANSNGGLTAPDPKAAALAAEGVDTAASSRDANKNAASAANKAEPPALKPVSDTRPSETATKPAQAPVDVKRDQRPAPAVAKSSDKASDKKKTDDKEKKKGGFLRVFKKIFGKD